MKKMTRRHFIGAVAGGAAVSVLNPGTLFASEEKSVSLPKPAADGKVSLIQALSLRKTIRTFSDKPLPQQMLSDLLWAACGVNRPDSGKRTAPTAKNWQEIDVYVTTADGLYLYDAPHHQLKQISTKDIRALTGKQDFVKNAPLNLVYISDFTKMTDAPEEKKMMYSYADAGFISQNVYLFCAAEGLAVVVRDSIDRPSLTEAMNLKPDQKIILSQTVGYPKS